MIKKHVHETFVIENLPTDKHENYSLPDEYFKLNNVGSYGMHFVEHNNVKECDIEIATGRTVVTLEIATKNPLVLTFTLA